MQYYLEIIWGGLVAIFILGMIRGMGHVSLLSKISTMFVGVMVVTTSCSSFINSNIPHDFRHICYDIIMLITISIIYLTGNAITGIRLKRKKVYYY